MSARYRLLAAFLFSILIGTSGCFTPSPSRGGGQVKASGSRAINPNDVLVPRGFRVEVVATGLNFPTGVTFDDRDRPCVVESGYSYGEVWTTPQLLRIEPDGKKTLIAAGTGG